MSDFDKPYMSPIDMIAKLKSKGLIITNDNKATELLEELGYNRLINGYKRPAIANVDDTESFNSDTTIEDLYTLYTIDFQFRELLLTNILHIENHLETLLGNLIAQKYNVNSHKKNDQNNPRPDIPSYLSRRYYAKSKIAPKILQHIENNILQKTLDNPTRYYRENKNHVPPWILTQNMPLGTLIKYYKIQKNDIKDAVVSSILPVSNNNLIADKLLFETALSLLKAFRNAAAHSTPIYLKKVKLGNYFSKNKLIEYLGTAIFSQGSDPQVELFGRNDLYGAMLSMVLLSNNISRRSIIINKLKNLDNSYKSSDYSRMYLTYLQSANLPIDYVMRLTSATKHIINLKGNNNLFSGDVAQSRRVYYLADTKTYHLTNSCPRIGYTTKEIYLSAEQIVIQQGFKKCKTCSK